eukprot:4803449-Amphidinium_carterae.1
MLLITASKKCIVVKAERRRLRGSTRSGVHASGASTNNCSPGNAQFQCHIKYESRVVRKHFCYEFSRGVDPCA